MASFLDADGIKAMLPMPSTTMSSVTMTSAAQILTPPPAQLQPSTQPPSEQMTQYQPTAAPSIGTLPEHLQYPTTLVAFVHEGEWERGTINVLTIRGTTFSVEEKSSRNLGQAFAVNSQGLIRSTAWTGPYMAPNASCTGVQPVTASTSNGWIFQPKSSGAFDVMVQCGGTGLKRISFENGSLALTSTSISGWFIVPLASA